MGRDRERRKVSCEESTDKEKRERGSNRDSRVLESKSVSIRLGDLDVSLHRDVSFCSRQSHVGVHLLEFFVEGLEGRKAKRGRSEGDREERRERRGRTNLVKSSVLVLRVEKLVLLILREPSSLFEVSLSDVELRLESENLDGVLRRREGESSSVSVPRRLISRIGLRLTFFPSRSEATSSFRISEFPTALLRSRSSSSTRPSRTPHQSSRKATSTPAFRDDEEDDEGWS